MGGRGASGRGGRGGGGGGGGGGDGKSKTSHAKSEIGKRRDRLKEQCKKSVPSKFTMEIKGDDGKRKKITVSVKDKDYKHLVNDAMDKKVVQESKIGKLGRQLKNSYYKKTSLCYKPRKDKIDRFYYLKTKGRKLYFNVARYKQRKKKGGYYYTYRLHAITKKCR